jgi:hypothetical protein
MPLGRNHPFFPKFENPDCANARSDGVRIHPNLTLTPILLPNP